MAVLRYDRVDFICCSASYEEVLGLDALIGIFSTGCRSDSYQEGCENQRMPALESGHIFHKLGFGPDIGYLLWKNLKLKMIVFVFIVLTSFANHE